VLKPHDRSGGAGIPIQWAGLTPPSRYANTKVFPLPLANKPRRLTAPSRALSGRPQREVEDAAKPRSTNAKSITPAEWRTDRSPLAYRSTTEPETCVARCHLSNDRFGILSCGPARRYPRTRDTDRGTRTSHVHATFITPRTPAALITASCPVAQRPLSSDPHSWRTGIIWNSPL